MKSYTYRVGTNDYHTQIELAWALSLKVPTLKTKLRRAGGRKKITSIEINGHHVQIIKTNVTKLV